jgi:hypothetical protein
VERKEKTKQNKIGVSERPQAAARHTHTHCQQASEQEQRATCEQEAVDLSVSDDMVIYSVCMKFNNTKGLITKL